MQSDTIFPKQNEGDADEIPALLRALPVLRMLDYGVASSDVDSLIVAAHTGHWAGATVELGGAHLDRAELHETLGEIAMAAQEREWAAAVFNICQVASNADSPERLRLYQQATAALADAMRRGGDLSRVELQTADGKEMFGWETIVPDPIGSVVIIGGLSGWGMSFLGLARALAKHRVSAVLAEGPGQGETRMRSGLHLSRASLPQFYPFIDLAQRRSSRVALIGISFGGLVAAHLAVARPDVAALVVNCSPVRLKTPQSEAVRAQIAAAFGLGGDALEAAIQDFCFDPSATPLQLPALVLEGGQDGLVPLGAQIEFFGGQARGAVTVRTWADGLHTLYNHAGERNALIAAWTADHLSPTS